MKIRSSLFAGIISLFLFSSCFHAIRNSGGSGLSEQDEREFALNYFDATKNKMIGNNDQALSLYLQCIRIDGKSDAAMYEAALLLADKNKYDNALLFMRGAVGIRPENIWYQLNLADLYQKNKLYASAVDVYEKLVKKYPDRVDFYFDWAEALLYAGKYAEAIKVYDKLESETGLSPDVSVQKEKLYAKLGKFDKAVNELLKLIAAFPNEPKYYGMLAELYQSNGMNDKAMDVLKTVQGFDPDNPYLHLSLAEYFRSNGEKDKSFEELKKAFSSSRLDLDTKISILSSYYLLLVKFPELKPQALELNKILVETHPAEARAFAVYGDFLFQDKKNEEARTQYREALRLDKQSFMVWQQILYLESELGDFQSMLGESEEGITLFPSQPLLYFFNGVAKIQLKREKEAVEILNTGVKLVIDNNPLLGQFYANLGDAYNRLKQNKESDEAFDHAIEINPKDSYVLNNYSYYLSLRSDSLEKAERMSRLSNELETKNASFQDTYAWILYKEGKYADAKQWLEKALEGDGAKNAVIMEHYGDVLWKLEMGEKALEYWKKAGEAGHGSDLLEKKIQEKKLFE